MMVVFQGEVSGVYHFLNSFGEEKIGEVGWKHVGVRCFMNSVGEEEISEVGWESFRG